jgi:hypothetical protein
MTDSMFRAHKKSSQEYMIPNYCSTKGRTISPQIQRRPQMGKAGGFSHKAFTPLGAGLNMKETRFEQVAYAQ